MSWINTDYVKYPTRRLHLGYQKLSRDEIDRVVDRLSLMKEETRPNINDEHSSGGIKKSRRLDQDDVHALVDRLSKETRKRGDVIKNDKTIVTSYAWCNGKLLHFQHKPLDGTWHWNATWIVRILKGFVDGDFKCKFYTFIRTWPRARNATIAGFQSRVMFSAWWSTNGNTFIGLS